MGDDASRRMGPPTRLAFSDHPPPAGEGFSDRLRVELSDGTPADTRLLVAADGARSAMREQAGIATYGWDYGQSAIVTTVAHERDTTAAPRSISCPPARSRSCRSRARRSSLVWTETDAEAARIVALPDDEFHAELERRFGLHLGDIGVAGRAAPIRSACSSRARSSPSASRWSATPRM